MHEEAPPSVPLRIAFWSAAIPFGLGCCIFLLWSVTYWEPLQALGLLNIALGLVLFLVGSGCLLKYFIKEISGRPVDAGRVLQGLAVGGLLLLNFPTCLAIIHVVGQLETVRWTERDITQSSVRVVNASDTEVESFIMKGAELPWTIKTISPGEAQSLFFEPRRDAEYTFTAMQHGSSMKATFRAPEEGTGTIDVIVVIEGDGNLHTMSFPPRTNWLGD